MRFRFKAILKKQAKPSFEAGWLEPSSGEEVECSIENHFYTAKKILEQYGVELEKWTYGTVYGEMFKRGWLRLAFDPVAVNPDGSIETNRDGMLEFTGNDIQSKLRDIQKYLRKNLAFGNSLIYFRNLNPIQQWHCEYSRAIKLSQLPDSLLVVGSRTRIH